ncbi:MAG: SpoIIE family protein phosphatase [Bacteroidales bacterium]|jgi:serine phosphatase RsbU (regulator of sigma subunit)|nr:SpoIIE family protein phosphatase [Bacteroidales bacterium]
MQHLGRIYIILFFFIAPQTLAQEGTPFITHYEEVQALETQNWSIGQSNENIMLFANRRGILTFDGQEWNQIKLPYIPLVVKINPYDQNVYMGTNNNYGVLEKNTKGQYEYQSLVPDTSDIGLITKIEFTDSTIFFYGEQTITRHNIYHWNNYKRWDAGEKSFTGIIITSKNTFFNVSGEGLYRLECDTLFPIVTGFYTENSEILFSLPYNDQRVIVGTDESKLYTFDGIKYYHYRINDEGYLKESILSDAVILSDTLIAFATLYGGVEVVSKKTGKIVYTINYQNGLPDDEIYSLGLDHHNGLWLSHAFGISRVDFNLPIRNFTTYPGLSGNLITSLWHNNQLYVGTSEGLFYLDEVKNYTEVEVFVKTKPKIKEETTAITGEDDEVEEESKKPIRKLFSRLFGGKEEEEETPATTTESNLQDSKSPTPKPRYVKKTISELQSINHLFKKAEGLHEKCKQLVSTEHGILAATNTGLYAIENHQAIKIINNRNINKISKPTDQQKYYLATNNGIAEVYYNQNEWVTQDVLVNFEEQIYSVLRTAEGFWCGGNDIAYKITTDTLDQPVSIKTYQAPTDFPEYYVLDLTNDTLFLFLESGIFFYHEKIDSFKIYKPHYANSLNLRYSLSEQGRPWVYHQDQWQCMEKDNPWTAFEQKLLRLFKNVNTITSDSLHNLWIINDNVQVFKIIHQSEFTTESNFNVYLKSITNDQGRFFELSDLVFEPDNQAIYVKITAPSYYKKETTQYQYYIKGLMKEWSRWSTQQTINLIAKPGKYTLQVRARDILDRQSPVKTVQFTIKPPFTDTPWFYILVGLVAIFIFYLIHKLREKKLIHDKKVLEQKVKERTLEIQEQKEEIEAQRDELETQRDEILHQKEDITGSITYASRIQRAMLPMDEHFEKAFTDYFILYKPRDIVSGDFYWIAEDTDKIYFAAADCTGHGVPGAFMSMLGISSLNEIIGGDKNQLTAAKILNLLRQKIKFSLHQTGKEGEAKDGMDIALCILHKEAMHLEYAGAFNPLYHFSHGELNEYKADRMPIGIYHVEKETFTNHMVNLKPGDTIYIFSDGYADQFGGPAQTKFKSTSLKKLFADIVHEPMNKQKEILVEKFDEWKGDLDQIDDIIVIGIKF